MRAFFFLLLMLGIMSCTRDDADIILTNGKIFTADTAQLYAQAVAIKGNRILTVGSNDAVAKLARGKTVVIDLQGKNGNSRL